MLKKNIGKVVVLVAIFTLVMSFSSVSFAMTPMEAVDLHLQQEFSGDVEGMTMGYSEDCIAFTTLQTAPVIGRDQMRAMLQKTVGKSGSMYGMMNKLGINVQTMISKYLTKIAVGDFVYMTIAIKPMMHGAETFNVQNDLIVQQTADLYLGNGILPNFF